MVNILRTQFVKCVLSTQEKERLIFLPSPPLNGHPLTLSSHTASPNPPPLFAAVEEGGGEKKLLLLLLLRYVWESKACKNEQNGRRAAAVKIWGRKWVGVLSLPRFSVVVAAGGEVLVLVRRIGWRRRLIIIPHGKE